MSAIGFSNQLITAFLKLIQMMNRCLLCMVTLLAVCLGGAALAQPIKGVIYKDFLPMGSGASVALPEGLWEVTRVSSLDYSALNWENYTLKNQQPDAKVPFLVVRQTTTTGQIGRASCRERVSSPV